MTYHGRRRLTRRRALTMIYILGVKRRKVNLDVGRID
jgi:hypothetical protein